MTKEEAEKKIKMNKGMYAFAKGNDIFVVVCKNKCPDEWQALSGLDGWEVESDDMFYIMGTDARGELEETLSEKLLVFKSNETTYFKCPISDDVLNILVSTSGEEGFMLIQSELLLDENQIYQKFTEGEIEGLICCFYTDEKKREIFNLDEKGNILELK
ncbi:hypothetical protein D0T84_13415 [Dysgonomonas sp. 521]|uniref:hypothetical protein n=1 Tax=Dysgonomonas sp. 521 TaxID=2302932 RepID=UPI0013D6BAE6|nr:hypothetical protein [Dysgonomonas sp. 521]NDV95902.1 hypothetical protein [Dysgonomonas sp. 521]